MLVWPGLFSLSVEGEGDRDKEVKSHREDSLIDIAGVELGSTHWAGRERHFLTDLYLCLLTQYTTWQPQTHTHTQAYAHTHSTYTTSTRINIIHFKNKTQSTLKTWIPQTHVHKPLHKHMTHSHSPTHTQSHTDTNTLTNILLPCIPSLSHIPTTKPILSNTHYHINQNIFDMKL